MDKARAETILELNEPYDYAKLRSSWKRLCADFHPDKCATTGMDREAADELLKDVNEAFVYLKPYVENGDTVNPSRRGGAHDAGARGEDPEKPSEAIYHVALSYMFKARTPEEFKEAAILFLSLGDYKDSAAKASECLESSMNIRQNAAAVDKEPSKDERRRQDSAKAAANAPKPSGQDERESQAGAPGAQEAGNAGYPGKGNKSGGSLFILFVVAALLVAGPIITSYACSTIAAIEAAKVQIPAGAEKKLYESPADYLHTKEAKTIVSRGREGDWEPAIGKMKRISFGEVKGDHGVATWFSGKYDSGRSALEALSMAIAQMEGGDEHYVEDLLTANHWSWKDSESLDANWVLGTITADGDVWYYKLLYFTDADGVNKYFEIRISNVKYLPSDTNDEKEFHGPCDWEAIAEWAPSGKKPITIK